MRRDVAESVKKKSRRLYESRFADPNRYEPLCETSDSDDARMEVVERKVRAMTMKESDKSGDDMMMQQRKDVELGPIVNLRLLSDERPSDDILSRESADTKIALKWDQLVVQEGLAYIRDDPLKPGEPPPLRLLLPRVEVQKAIRLCHAGTVGGHFGVKKTLSQVRRPVSYTHLTLPTILRV